MGGWERIVVDAALTSVISAEIETRCRDDEEREAGGRGVEGEALKVDEGEEITMCNPWVPRCKSSAIHVFFLKKEREIEGEGSCHTS